MAKVAFGMKKGLSKEDKKLINDAPLVENNRTMRGKKNRSITVMCSQEDYDTFNNFINENGLSRSKFIRQAIKAEMVKRETESAQIRKALNPVWEDEPFLISDAAKFWNVSLYRIRDAIHGGGGRPPKFLWNEWKRINGTNFIVTRKGMTRVFGKQVVYPEETVFDKLQAEASERAAEENDNK